MAKGTKDEARSRIAALYSVYVDEVWTRRIPGLHALTPNRSDQAALDDILNSQHFGDVRAAAKTVRELARMPGSGLVERYVALHAWYASGRPLPRSGIQRRAIRAARKSIDINARARRSVA